MSQENVKVVGQAFAAYAERGVEGVLALVAEDAVVYSIPEWPDDVEYHGHEGFGSSIDKGSRTSMTSDSRSTTCSTQVT